MKETGQLLKKVRIEKDIKLEKVSQALKIGVRVLKAIEEDDQAKLPPRVFLRGFVHSYAQYLQADVDLVMDTFHREMDGGGSVEEVTQENEIEPVVEKIEPVKAESKKTTESKPPRYVWAVDYSKWTFATKAMGVFVVVTLVVLIYFVLQVVEKYEREAFVRMENEIASPPLAHDTDETDPTFAQNESESLESEMENPEAPESSEPPVAKLEEAAPSPPAVAKVEKEVKAEPQPTAKTETPAKPETQKAESKVTTTQPEKPKVEEVTVAENTRPAAEKSTASSTSATRTQAEDAKPENTRPPASQANQVSHGSQEVIVEAFDHVNLTYSLDSEPIVTVKLEPGDMHTLKADKRIRLEASDGGIINVFHNGKDRGVPGQIGKSMRLSFP